MWHRRTRRSYAVIVINCRKFMRFPGIYGDENPTFHAVINAVLGVTVKNALPFKWVLAKLVVVFMLKWRTCCRQQLNVTNKVTCNLTKLLLKVVIINEITFFKVTEATLSVGLKPRMFSTPSHTPGLLARVIGRRVLHSCFSLFASSLHSSLSLSRHYIAKSIYSPA